MNHEISGRASGDTPRLATAEVQSVLCPKVRPVVLVLSAAVLVLVIDVSLLFSLPVP